MTKLKVWKDFLEKQLKKLKKVEDYDPKDVEISKRIDKPDKEDEEEHKKEKPKKKKSHSFRKAIIKEITKDMIVNDFITTDFQVINDSTLGGYVVRDGAFPYRDPNTGEKVVKYKDWDNLKEAYGNIDKAIAYGSKYQDSHYESDSRMLGYWDNFKFVERGMPGIYAQEGVPSHDPNYNKRMDIDEKHNRVWSRLNTNKDITELSDLKPEDLRNLPVSASYDDLGVGNKQKVGKIHHIAVSLNKNEQDRCSQMGTACNVSIMDTTHDHSLIEVESATDSDTNNKGVLRADFSQPPKKKNKKEKAKMGKKKKDKDAEEDEEEVVEEDTIEEDVADGENKIMTGGEKKYPKGKVEGDDPEVEEKIKGSPYGSPKGQKIGAKGKDLIEIDAVKDMIAEGIKEGIKEAMKPYKEQADAKESADFREILVKEPYGYSEDYLKDKSLTKLTDIKEDFEQSKAYKDFVEKADDFGGISDVNKSLFEEGVQHKNVMADFIGSAQKAHWAWADPETRKDFFKEGFK